MGNLHRIRKSIQPKIAMADAHIEVNGCRIFLGHPNPDMALSSAKGFSKMLAGLIERSKRVNMHDMYESSFRLQRDIESGAYGLNARANSDG